MRDLVEVMDVHGLAEGTAVTISESAEIMVDGRAVHVIPVAAWLRGCDASLPGQAPPRTARKPPLHGFHASLRVPRPVRRLWSVPSRSHVCASLGLKHMEFLNLVSLLLMQYRNL